MRRVAMLSLVAVIAVRPAFGQSAEAAPQQTRTIVPPIVHYGKWAAAALFAGFTTLGVVEHDKANTAFDGLRNYCRTGASCMLAADGHYANPVAEARYQDVVHGDRAARAWLLSGQVALAGATTLFVIELLRQHGTHNIPFHGLTVMPGRSATRIGWQVPF